MSVVHVRQNVGQGPPKAAAPLLGLRPDAANDQKWVASCQMLSLKGRVPTLAAVIVEGKPKRGRTEQVPRGVALEETVRRADHTILI